MNDISIVSVVMSAYHCRAAYRRSNPLRIGTDDRKLEADRS